MPQHLRRTVAWALLATCAADPVLRVSKDGLSAPVDFPIGSLVEDLFETELPASPVPLHVADDACDAEAPSSAPFVLLARNGSCSVAAKKRTAVAAGATALLVVDNLASLYVNVTSTAAMTLNDTCLVDCELGHGTIDASSVDIKDVLAGLPGSYPAPVGYNGPLCHTSLCALSGPPPTDGSTERQVCCVLDQPPAAAPPEGPSEVVRDASGRLRPIALLPTATLSLGLSHVLLELCADGTCTVELVDAPAPPARWDGSGLLVWLLATTTAALAAYLAAAAQTDEDTSMAQFMGGSGGGHHGGSGGDAHDPSMAASATLDTATSFGFLLMAATGLLGMYLVITLLHVKSAVLVLISIGFVRASSSASSQVRPRLIRPHSFARTRPHSN